MNASKNRRRNRIVEHHNLANQKKVDVKTKNLVKQRDVKSYYDTSKKSNILILFKVNKFVQN